MATDISGLRLSVRYDEGQGPVMVLLHGINSDATDWRKVIDTIGGGYRFVAVDLLGFGDSPKPVDIAYTSDEHALVLDHTLDELGIDRPFLLVGYSLGGDIAIRYASTFPRKVRRLFLLSTPFYLPPNAFESRGFGRQYLQVILFQRAWKFVSNSKKRDNLLYQIVEGKAQEAAKQFLRTDDVPAHWDIMSKNLRNCIGKATFIDDLPKLDMPVTFALGIRDPIVHPDQTPDLKRLKPDIDIRRIVGLSADHFMLLNLPETVAREIVRDEVDELNVRYRAGRGEPTVFLHGIGEDTRFWEPVARALTTRREVALIDLLGCGDSPAPLSLRYDLEDHVDAVSQAIGRVFPGKRVHLVGHGFGAVVAVAFAEAMPDAALDVTAFSPVFLPPGQSAESLGGPLLAEIQAIRERARQMVGDPRSRVAAERAEERVVPLLRTLDSAIVDPGSAAPFARDLPATTFVLPTEDTLTPRSYLRSVAAANQDAGVIEPQGTRWMPIEDPRATVLLLDPGAIAEADAAATMPRPRPEAGLDALRDAFSSTSTSVLLRGCWTALLGLALLLVRQVPPRLIAIGFAVWVLVEGLTTIAGAVGLRRSGKGGWLPWLLIGALSFVVAILLVLSPEANLRILAFVIAVRALYIGVADLYVARRVSRTPMATWLLVAQGVIGVAIAVFLLVDPATGARLLKVVLGVYLLVTGASSIAYALAARRAVRHRVRSALAAEQTALH